MATAKKATVDIDDEIRQLLEVSIPAESVQYINALLYGEPGSGKTHLLGTCADSPEFSPFLLIDVEGGAMTLRNRPDIDVMQVRSMRQVEKAINDLARHPDYYKAAAIDSATELQKLDMRTVMKAEEDRMGSDKVDVYVPSQRAWGKSGERMRMIIRAFKDLEMHTFVTCLQATDRDDRTNKTTYFPSLPGKLKAEVSGFFDIVGLLRAKDEKGEDDKTTIIRTLQVAKTESVIAKDRTSALGSVVREPTIPLLWDMIHNGKGVA